MARIIQLLLPLVCAVFAEAHLHLPFIDIPGLQHPSLPDLDTRHKQPLDKNINNFDHQSWLHHAMGHRHPSLSDGDVHSYNRHRNEESYEDFNPFLNSGLENYFGGPYGMGNFNPMSNIKFPGMTNALNIPDNGFNTHDPQASQVVSNSEEHKKDSNDDNNIVEAENLKEKPDDVASIDKKPAEQDKDLDLDPKSIDANSTSISNKPEELPPKTNEVKKNNTSGDLGNKKEKDIDLNKNKDYLLVGSGNNGNNVYLLHENSPIPTTVVVPNANQAANNVIYIPNYPGQNNNPVSQVVNQQPTNLQVSPNKITVNGYNNGIANTAQPINTGNQNPGYVLVYSNGQLIQIPGVVVNSPQNNVPIQNSYPLQGTNYIIANTVPNNVQATQNPATNVIYATLPNQGSNGPIVIQMPQCIHGMSNNVCSSGAVVQNPVQGVNNGANIVSNNGLVSNYNQPNQNVFAQPAVLLTSGVSNGYAQPTTIPQGVNAGVLPSQGAVLSNQNGVPQIAVQLPVNSASNQYNQPIVSSLQPNQGTVNTQNVLLQPAVQIPANTSPNGYSNQPVVSIQTNVASQNQGESDQNAIQPSPPVNNASNGNNQPQAPNQGDQGIVNTPDHDAMSSQPEIDIRNAVPASSLPNNDSMALDDNSLSALGAQPAIMISSFKETTNDKSDKTNGKTKKGKKDKSKKKNKKNKDSGESKEEKPLINKKK